MEMTKDKLKSTSDLYSYEGSRGAEYLWKILNNYNVFESLKIKTNQLRPVFCVKNERDG